VEKGTFQLPVSLESGQDLRIGEFLIAAEIVQRRELTESLSLARRSGLPIGRVLVVSGLVSENGLRQALKVQSMVRDSILPFRMGVDALKLACSEELSLEEALSRLGWSEGATKQTNKLGELLLTAEVINQQTLETAMRTAEATGMPLGRSLISLGLLSDEMLSAALDAQVLVRDFKIGRQQSVDGLRAAKKRREPVDEMLKEQGFLRGPLPNLIRLGQLFNEAGVIGVEQLWNALTRSFVQQISIGQALCEMKLIDREQLQYGLLVQEMVANRTLDFLQASEVLHSVCRTKNSLATALSHLALRPEKFKSNLRFHDLLRVAGMINNQVIDLLRIEHKTPPSSQDAFDTAHTILSNGVLSERSVNGASRCYFLLATGWLNIQQAIVALSYFRRRDCDFDTVLQELQWTIKTFVRDED
jgi:hypothetical protein